MLLGAHVASFGCSAKQRFSVFCFVLFVNMIQLRTLRVISVVDQGVLTDAVPTRLLHCNCAA